MFNVEHVNWMQLDGFIIIVFFSCLQNFCSHYLFQMIRWCSTSFISVLLSPFGFFSAFVHSCSSLSSCYPKMHDWLVLGFSFGFQRKTTSLNLWKLRGKNIFSLRFISKFDRIKISNGTKSTLFVKRNSSLDLRFLSEPVPFHFLFSFIKFDIFTIASIKPSPETALAGRTKHVFFPWYSLRPSLSLISEAFNASKKK